MIDNSERSLDRLGGGYIVFDSSRVALYGKGKNLNCKTTCTNVNCQGANCVPMCACPYS